MARIKIADIPADQKITKAEMKRIMGGRDLITLDVQQDVNRTNTMFTLMSNIMKSQKDSENTIIDNAR